MEFQALIHVLQLASKTGVTLSEAGNGDVAGSVLTSAARFEELLRNAEDADGAHRVQGLSDNHFQAWKEGNHGVATYMQTMNNRYLSYLPTIGDGWRANCMTSESQGGAFGNEDSEGVNWLQRAFAVADKLDDAAAHTVPELKVALLSYHWRDIERVQISNFADDGAYFISGRSGS
ncbi:hypothetical protein B0H16DRAFT_1728291 [Mycena metata]|uniref:Uncharacterized protein n=1 Tax=Mycena metata TaxID=1033252 RepID=A0AAD7IFQ5_9AGAR|nr:hypothetical protein B0H16DRAFT_1728291 [Mycena metata]